MNRRITTPVTIVVLLAVLVVGAVWGFRSLTADVPGLGSAGPQAACETSTVAAGSRLARGEVTVSVFNAGTTSGLASKMMKQLRQRGFSAGDTGNAPDTARVRVATVWAADPRDPAVRLVAQQLGTDTRVVPPKGKLGAGVVVLVGDDFTRLVKAPRSVEVRQDTEVCTPG